MSKQTYEQRWGHSRTKVQNGSAERERRRVEAEARQKEWASLSDDEKMERLGSRPGESKKQFSKLLKK